MLANLYLISLRSLFLRMCLWKKKSLTCKAFGHTPSKKNRVENADKAIANATNPCNNKKLEHWDMPNVIPRTGNSELGRGDIKNVVQVATSSS